MCHRHISTFLPLLYPVIFSMGHLHSRVYIEKNTALSAAILRSVVTYLSQERAVFFLY